MKKIALILIVLGVAVFLYTFFMKPVTEAIEEKVNPDETGLDTSTGVENWKPFTEL